MAKIFEELDFQETSLGELSLRRKHVTMLENQEVYEVKLGDAFLMTSMFHAVEDALANLGLGELTGSDWDVVVGGLGLGYTARSALDHTKVRTLTVVEFLQPVIDWHRRGMVTLGPQLTADTRCSFLQGDFFALAVSSDGFRAGQRFHAILLDIDHSPHNLLHERNAVFYSPAGLSALAHQLHPGGIFAMWSDDAPDQGFMETLLSVFADVRAEVVKFPNPFLDCDSASTVYIGRKAPAAH